MGKLFEQLRRSRPQIKMLAVLAGMVVWMGLASPYFLQPNNLINILQQSAINAILALGLTGAIIAGGIDLSVGSVLALAGWVLAYALQAGLAVGWACMAAVGIGALCGAINGWLAVKVKIPPFIATLGMMLVARSAAKVLSGAEALSGLPQSFRALAGDGFGVPLLVFWAAALFALGHYLLGHTRFGRYLYAVGGNARAAWLAGVPVARVQGLSYVLSGSLAGVAAILLTARLNAASPLAGEMYELYAIAAAVIGGVSLAGGQGHVLGTLLGALMMGILRNGLNLVRVPSAWEGVVIGVVLVAAVVLDRARHQAGAASSDRSRKALPPQSFWMRWLVVGGVCGGMLLGGWALRRQHVSQGKQWVMGLVPKTLASPFFTAMADGAQAEAQRLGVKLVVLAADRETDVAQQHQIVENLLRQNIDALLLVPSGAKALVPAVAQANRASVPVMLVDSKLDDALMRADGVTVLGFVGSDNALGGRLAGDFLRKHLPAGAQVAVIDGVAGHETAQSRREGFLAAAAKSPALKVVAVQTGQAERARAYTVAQNLLQAHPELAGIFAINDEMALGAWEAVVAAGRQKQVKVVGFDANPDAKASVHQGGMAATIAQYPAEMGRLGVQHVVDFLRDGVKPPEWVATKVGLVDRKKP